MASKQTPSVKISNPELTDITSDSITVTWKPQIKGISETKVHFQVAAEGHFPDGGFFRRVDAPKKNTCTFTGLRDKTVYSFYIIALDETDEELKQYPEDEDDEPLTDITKAIDVTAPSVGSRKLTVVNRFADGFDIQWKKAKDKVSAQKDIRYECWIKKAGSTQNAKKIWSEKDLDQVHITGLKSGTAYDFYVLAIDEAGNSLRYPGEDKYETAETLDTVAPEVKDPKISVVEFTQDSISIRWEPATDNDTSQKDLKYWVYLREHGMTQRWGDPVEKSAQIQSYKFTDLKPSTEYDFRVVAYDRSNNPFEYRVGSQRTTDTEAPKADPKSIQVTKTTTDSLSLVWEPAKDNVSASDKIQYILYWKRNRTNESWSLKKLDPGVSSAEITSLKPDSEYGVFIKAYDEANNEFKYYDESNPCLIRTAKDTTSPEVQTAALGVTRVTKDSISIEWKMATDNVTPKEKISYEVYWTRHDDSQCPWDYAKVGTSVSSYTISNLRSNTRYAIYVKAIDGAGNALKYMDKGNYCLITTHDGTPPTVADPSLTVTYKDTSSFSIQWNPATDNKIAKQQIYYKVHFIPLEGNGNWTIYKQGKDFCTCTFTGMKDNSTYRCYVTAEDEVGNVLKYSTRDISTTQKRVLTYGSSFDCNGHLKSTPELYQDLGTKFNRYNFRLLFNFKFPNGLNSQNYHILSLDSRKNTLSILLRPAPSRFTISRLREVPFVVYVSVNGGKRTFDIGTVSALTWNSIDLTFSKGKLTVNGKDFEVGSLDTIMNGNNFLTSQDANNRTCFKGVIKDLEVVSL